MQLGQSIGRFPGFDPGKPLQSSCKVNFKGVVMPREICQLQCTECKDKNYSTTKNRKTTTERLEFSKFCRKCRKHTPHKEVK